MIHLFPFVHVTAMKNALHYMNIYHGRNEVIRRWIYYNRLQSVINTTEMVFVSSDQVIRTIRLRPPLPNLKMIPETFSLKLGSLLVQLYKVQ